jgi:CheY-like chemotaxis protein
MTGKMLVVEDEPIIALDLAQELEHFGFEVVALARSADEAIMAVEETRPDLVLMDMHILGPLDGVETARLLRNAYEIPSIFLTAHSDDRSISRAMQEMPYGYLTKPFQARELKATIQVALHKARADADIRNENAKSSSALNGMCEGLIALSLDGEVLLMNSPGELLTGVTRENAIGHHFRDVLQLDDAHSLSILLPMRHGLSGPIELFGLCLAQPGRDSVPVDLSISSTVGETGLQTGYILTIRSSAKRLLNQSRSEAAKVSELFDLALTPMIQLDGSGHIVRVNQALQRESGVGEKALIGRTLCELSRDQDARISGRLMHQLLQGNPTESGRYLP